MALNIGDRLAHYDVTALIGEGGMVFSQTGDASIRAAYDAPFPDPSYKAGPLKLPQLIPLTRDYDGVTENLAAWEVFRRLGEAISHRLHRR